MYVPDSKKVEFFFACPRISLVKKVTVLLSGEAKKEHWCTARVRVTWVVRAGSRACASPWPPAWPPGRRRAAGRGGEDDTFSGRV